MNNFQLIKLKFGSVPVHFGELGIGLEESKERVHSDTLFSAWVSSYARLFDKEAVELLLAKFLENPPVRMSSTFIYRQISERTIFYLPKPLRFPINYRHCKDLKFFKTYKGINYLPLEIWQRWYQGEGFTTNDAQELINKTNKIDGEFNELKNAGTFNYKDAFYASILPKVAIDRVNSTSNIYHTKFIQYRHEKYNQSGLYFLLKIHCDDKELIEKLKVALFILGEQGLGGERTSGAGQFQAEWLDLPAIWQSVINFSDTNQHHCLFSMFWDNDQS
ncbi:MAG: type III-A CRISPR-associated RAMP protein Csm4, partial [Calothrix sp. SM1_7_51]|nr:type III-A CRISPR-associated RAMP protein Csm4 [Calothrix sp. SM1_7_51]